MYLISDSWSETLLEFHFSEETQYNFICEFHTHSLKQGDPPIELIPDSPCEKNNSRTPVSPIIWRHRKQGLTHLLGRQDKHVWLVVKQLRMKVGWWDAPLKLRELAKAISKTLALGDSPSCFHGASMVVKFLFAFPKSQSPSDFHTGTTKSYYPRQQFSNSSPPVLQAFINITRKDSSRNSAM